MERADLAEALARLLSPDQVMTSGPEFRQALSDGTVNRGISGTADALVEPESPEEVAAVLAFCYENGLPLSLSSRTLPNLSSARGTPAPEGPATGSGPEAVRACSWRG